MSNSHYEYIINYGEGFWQDHFTYVLDLIENYLRIYPDKEKELLFDDKTYKFFQSPVKVKPRAEKSYLMPDGKIRQHEALWWVEGVDKWASHNGKPLEVNLASKLLTLILNKYSLLDSENLGIMYEADRPGWNDALNGLPGVFGSGIGEMIELLRLVRYFDKAINLYKINQIKVLKPLVELINNLLKNNKFAARIEAVELYRSKLDNLELESLEMKVIK